MARRTKQTRFTFSESKSEKSIDLVSEQLTDELRTLTTDNIRVPLNQATEHYINLNRLMAEGFEVIGDMNTLNKAIPGIVEAFRERGDTPEDVMSKVDTTMTPMNLTGTADVKTLEKRKGAKGRYVFDAYINVRNKCNKLFDLMGAQMGHQQVTPISAQLALVALAYQKLEDSLSRFAMTERGVGRVGVQRVTNADQAEGLQRANIKTVADIKKLKKKIQTLMFGFELIQKLPYVQGMKKMKGNPFDHLIDVYNDVQGMKDFNVQTLKDKIIDTVNGKVKLELRAESPEYNKFKSRYESLMLTATDQLTAGKTNDALEKFLKTVDIGDVTGSPAIENKIVKDITDIARGKKVKPSRTRTRTTKRAKTGKKGRKISKNNLKKLTKATRAGKAILAKGAITPGKAQKGKTGREQLDLAKVQIAINQKLPAEVRRNMGRPALINQTGRFSNSVRLTGLRQAPASVVADYTYQLNPYETFENNGDKQWPAGYNPKPLIAKSIRNLAAAFIDQKFTLRRV